MLLHIITWASVNHSTLKTQQQSAVTGPLKLSAAVDVARFSHVQRYQRPLPFPRGRVGEVSRVYLTVEADIA